MASPLCGCYAVSEMNRAACWIARFLMLALLAPALSPLAMARALSISMQGQSMQEAGTHCLRRKAASSMKPACHGSMPEAKEPGDPSSETAGAANEVSFHASESCCQNHDCCSRAGRSQQDGFFSISFSSCSPLLERSTLVKSSVVIVKAVFAPESARAPPLR